MILASITLALMVMFIWEKEAVIDRGLHTGLPREGKNFPYLKKKSLCNLMLSKILVGKVIIVSSPVDTRYL